jgi:hypothetical protein
MRRLSSAPANCVNVNTDETGDSTPETVCARVEPGAARCFSRLMTRQLRGVMIPITKME